MDRKQLNERILEFQRETMFPPKELHEDFNDWKRRTLQHVNPTNTKMMVEDFIAICEKREDFTLWDMGYLLHAMEQRTAHQLSFDLDQYAVFMRSVEDMVKVFRGIAGPKQEALQREFEALQAIEQPNSGRIVDMQPIVKGEA